MRTSASMAATVWGASAGSISMITRPPGNCMYMVCSSTSGRHALAGEAARISAMPGVALAGGAAGAGGSAAVRQAALHSRAEPQTQETRRSDIMRISLTGGQIASGC